MLGAFHDVIRRFLATYRVNELFNRGANELRLTTALISRALEHRLFDEMRHPDSTRSAFDPERLTHDAGEANRSEEPPRRREVC